MPRAETQRDQRKRLRIGKGGRAQLPSRPCFLPRAETQRRRGFLSQTANLVFHSDGALKGRKLLQPGVERSGTPGGAPLQPSPERAAEPWLVTKSEMDDLRRVPSPLQCLLNRKKRKCRQARGRGSFAVSRFYAKATNDDTGYFEALDNMTALGLGWMEKLSPNWLKIFNKVERFGVDCPDSILATDE